MRILHISDVHYGCGVLDGKTRHHFVHKGTPDPSRLPALLQKDPALGFPPDVVAISGDLGWAGVDKDYELAKSFLDTLRDLWPKAEFIVIPGNHDVDQECAKAGNNPQLSFLRLLQDFYGTDFWSFYPLAKIRTPDDFDRESLVIVRRINDEALIVAVNTAAYLGETNTPVYVSRAILEEITEHIKNTGMRDDLLRIFVMHHHLLPFAETLWGNSVDVDAPPVDPDPTIVANSGRLQSWLADNSFSLVLHGHKHSVHIRKDSLWRPQHGADRAVLVFGAGSSGVYRKEIPPGESLTYNVLEISRLARQRFGIRATIRHIDPNDYTKPITEAGFYAAETGPTPHYAPTSFFAEKMDDCHKAIAESTKQSRLIHNFISVVEFAEYIHPTTACIRGKSASLAQIDESFRKLHPEYDDETGWNDPHVVHERLTKLEPRFRFEHGPRLFGFPGHNDYTSDLKASPIQKAIEALRSQPSRAYAGLFNSIIDVLSKDQPLPALTGIQLLPENDSLDLIATFRNLELSFWWVVNMYEMIRLLDWVTTRPGERLKPRRITFFSPLAIWRDDPEPNFVAELDAIPLTELTTVVLDAAAGLLRSRNKLEQLLSNKHDQTSDANLDYSGLTKLADLLDVVNVRDETKFKMTNFSAVIRQCIQHIRVALEQPEQRRSRVDKARNELSKAQVLLSKSSP